MKALFVLGLLIPMTAVAVPTTEVFQTKQTLKVSDMHCKIQLYSGVPVVERTFTEISTSGNYPILLHTKNILLSHVKASGKGCSLPELEKIMADSHATFGFRYGVPVEVVRVTQRGTRRTDGSCTALVRETLHIELDKGISLISVQTGLLPATDCK